MGKQEEFELEMVSVRLVKDAPLISKKPITTPSEAVELLGELLAQMDREMVCIVNVRSDGAPINAHVLGIGTLNYCVMHPREVYKSSILSNAASTILLHSHPSGKITPSSEDIAITKKLVKVGELIDIPLLDHIIVGGINGQFFSMQQEGIFPKSRGGEAVKLIANESNSINEEKEERRR